MIMTMTMMGSVAPRVAPHAQPDTQGGRPAGGRTAAQTPAEWRAPTKRTDRGPPLPTAVCGRPASPATVAASRAAGRSRGAGGRRLARHLLQRFEVAHVPLQPPQSLACPPPPAAARPSRLLAGRPCTAPPTTSPPPPCACVSDGCRMAGEGG
jgi:hypothetical protein